MEVAASVADLARLRISGGAPTVAWRLPDEAGDGKHLFIRGGKWLYCIGSR